MESLKIRTGQINLQIIGDDDEPRGVFSFNPEDVEAAKRYMSIRNEMTEKQKEFERQEERCETDEEKMQLLNDIVNYFEEKIDECFGSGSSKLLFGDNKSLSMFSDFFEGIAPYFEAASKKRIDKYSKK